MHKIVSITLFSFLILFLVFIGLFSSKKKEGEVLQSIDLQGCKLLSEKEYLLYANINEISDVGNYSLSSLRDKFLRHPYIKNVSVVKDVDNKVEVEIVEKSFEAVALLNDKLFLVTTEKKFVPVLANTEVLDFPVLTNFSENSVSKEIEQSSELASAFTILNSARKLSEKLSQSISEINLRKGGDILLSLTRANSIIILGKQNLAEKIYTLDELLKQIGSKISLTNANYIDLRYANNIFVGANESAGI
jgi:cell division septal protein FtsQ